MTGRDDAPRFVETDELFYGRELNRHAARAHAAQRALDESRATLDRLAVRWDEQAKERRQRAADAIPFGEGAVSEADAAALRGEGDGLARAADELRAVMRGEV